MIGEIGGEGSDPGGRSSLERTAEQHHQPDRLAEKPISTSTADTDTLSEPDIAHYPIALRVLIFIFGSLSAWALVYWAVKG